MGKETSNELGSLGLNVVVAGFELDASQSVVEGIRAVGGEAKVGLGPHCSSRRQ
ncbi:hypothetical protein M1D93_20485 (plasmid) [Arthrobacter sp. Z1-9]